MVSGYFLYYDKDFSINKLSVTNYSFYKNFTPICTKVTEAKPPVIEESLNTFRNNTVLQEKYASYQRALVELQKNYLDLKYSKLKREYDLQKRQEEHNKDIFNQADEFIRRRKR